MDFNTMFDKEFVTYLEELEESFKWEFDPEFEPSIDDDDIDEEDEENVWHIPPELWDEEI